MKSGDLNLEQAVKFLGEIKENSSNVNIHILFWMIRDEINFLLIFIAFVLHTLLIHFVNSYTMP